jgi:hypothetical protein
MQSQLLHLCDCVIEKSRLAVDSSATYEMDMHAWRHEWFLPSTRTLAGVLFFAARLALRECGMLMNVTNECVCCLHLRVLASLDAGSCCLVAVSQAMHVRALCLVACIRFGSRLARSLKHLGPGSPDTSRLVASPEPGSSDPGSHSQVGERNQPNRSYLYLNQPFRFFRIPWIIKHLIYDRNRMLISLFPDEEKKIAIVSYIYHVLVPAERAKKVNELMLHANG